MNDERIPAGRFFAGDLKTRFHLTILQAAVMLQLLYRIHRAGRRDHS
jgi:hypothetical protein